MDSILVHVSCSHSDGSYIDRWDFECCSMCHQAIGPAEQETIADQLSAA